MRRGHRARRGRSSGGGRVDQRRSGHAVAYDGRALLPPDTLDTFRRQILIALHEHPDAEYLLKQLRPPPVVFESGEVAIVGAAPAGADAPKQGSGGR